MKYMLILFLLCTSAKVVLSQSIGIGTSTPHASARLEVSSTNQGFLPPRMSQSKRNAIQNPAAGLVIWCNNCGTNGQLQVYNGLRWTNACGDTAATAAPEPGDTAFGGYIFYVFQPGDQGYVSGETHGLVSAAVDQNDAEWGCQGTFLSGTNVINGSGLANTNAMAAGCATPGHAANICLNLSLNGYSDWYLPSRAELQLMYTALHQNSLGNFATDIPYWSSSENTFLTAWYVRFSNGGFDFNGKSVINHVRAIRRF